MGCSSSSSAATPPTGGATATATGGQQNKDGVPLYGISQAYLASLVREHKAEKFTVGEFCDKVVKPMTSAKKCSLVEELRGQSATAKHVKPVADVFISYAWRYTMGDFLDCLLAGDTAQQSDRFIWMDCCVINQHSSSEVHQEQWLETFSSALKTIGQAELLLMPWQKPIPVERSWCVFEQYVITSQKIPFKAKMLPQEAEEVRTSLRKGDFVFKTFLKTFASIDCEKSTAFKEDDQRHILGLLRSKKAVKATNDATMLSVKQFLLDATLGEAEAALNDGGQGGRQEEHGNVFHGVGTLLDALGEAKKAVRWYEQSVAVRRQLDQSKKQNKIDLASSLSDLGACLMKLDRISEAETLFNESYALKREALGDDHPDTIKSRGWMGTVLYRQKKFNDALPIFTQVVEANIRVLGKDHENTSRSVNNLASCYKDLGQPAKALEYFEMSLDITQRMLGDSHPDVAVCLNNMAVCYDSLKQPAKAVECYTRAVEIQRKTLGDGHQNVGIALHNLAMTVKEMGDQDKAREYGKEALEIFTKTLGPNNGNTKMLREMWG